MGTQLQEIYFADFKGGLVSNLPSTSLATNQAQDLKNILILPGGKGFVNRPGNTAFNATTIGAAEIIQGLGYYQQADGDDWLMCVANAKLYKSDSLDGTWDDITGALTITESANSIWDIFTFRDTAIGVGGRDAPFKWAGSGNGAALGGSPPSGNGGFAAGNRLFIYSPSAAPSTIYYTTLTDMEDWSGTGSGNSTVSEDDGSELVGHSVLNNDTVLLFKENSIHRFLIRTRPFSLTPLFVKGTKGEVIGAVGKDAIVNARGITYFITPEARMKATDGVSLIDFPADLNDVWDGLNASRLKYIHGFYAKGVYSEYIIWLCSNTTSTTHNLAIVWDLNNKCWLKFDGGFTANVAVTTNAGTIYTGHYDGTVYKQFDTTTYTDASNSGASIGWKWEGGWWNNNQIQSIKRPQRFAVIHEIQKSGTYDLTYSFDFGKATHTESISLGGIGAKYDTTAQYDDGVSKYSYEGEFVHNEMMVDRGNLFKIQFSGASEVETKIYSFSLYGKFASGTKEFKSE